MKKDYVIYEHVNKINGKRYIGMTCQIPSKRWSNGNKYQNPVFKADVEKYGWDNFEHNILLKDLTRKEAQKIEADLIYDLDLKNPNKGYNQVGGGSGGGMYNKRHNEDAKEQIRCKMKVRAFTDEHKLRISQANSGKNHPLAKKVYQYTKSGKLIKVWDYMTDASNYLNIPKTNISACCLNKRKSAGGYIWKYE